MTKLKILIGLTSLLILLIIVYYILISINSKNITNINKLKDRKNININSLPIIEDHSKYIELQTKEWIKKRDNKLPCYAVLEKDKVVMCSWIEKFKINGPDIHFYDYHFNVTYDKFKEVINLNKTKRLIVKLTHLQSSYGIIIIDPIIEINDKEKYLKEKYNKILNLFDKCFVCNHDKNDPPTLKEIQQGKKQNYYKLYETIEPGILIQDFFYSQENEKVCEPTEIKILVFGNNIVKIGKIGVQYIFQKERYKLLIQEAKRVSNCLGAHLIRVDFFVKNKDNPYIPYINEISLSPNGGMNTNYFLTDSVKQDYIKDVKNYKKKSYDYVDNLIKNSPYRSIPVKGYLTDSDNISYADKFSFGTGLF